LPDLISAPPANDGFGTHGGSAGGYPAYIAHYWRSHTYIENEGMYPAVRDLLPTVEDDVLESYEEHHVADVSCMELAAMSADHERFDAKTTVLIESVTHHIEEEEQEWFPQAREAVSRTQPQEPGQRLLDLRRKAPHSPAQPGALKKVADAVLS
jgi:Hemerythrin HHE cation binding domain